MLGEYIGEYLSRISIHKGLQFFLAHSVIPLENAHGLVPACRHDPEIIMALQPPIIDGGMSEIMENKPGYSSFFADCLMDHSNVMGGNRFPITMKNKLTGQMSHLQGIL